MMSALFVNHTITSKYNATYIHDNDETPALAKPDSMPRLQIDTNILKKLK